MDGQDYLSGSLAKIDHRPAPVIFKDAQQAMLKSNWRDADVALERIIIRMTLKEIGKVAALEDRQMLVQCEAMRGDCLKAMKLPYAAIYMYNTAANHIHTSSIGDVFVGDMQQRAAGVWETLPSDPIASRSWRLPSAHSGIIDLHSVLAFTRPNRMTSLPSGQSIRRCR